MIDYEKMLRDQMASGASADTITQIKRSRDAKLDADPSLEKYRNNNGINDDVAKYISGYKAPSAQSSAPAAAPYKSEYTDLIASTLGKISGRQPFSYDHTADPSYLALKDTYTREGQNAMQDTMGALSSRTGGLASSFAGSMGAQAYNSFMQKLGDSIPQLEAQKYGRYRDEGNDLYNLLGAYQGMDNTGYGRYRDTVGDQQWGMSRQDNLDRYDTDRQDMLDQRGIDNSRWDMQWDNTMNRQGIEDQRYDQQYGDSRNDANFGKAQTLLQMGFSTAEIAQTLGITEQQAQQYANTVQAGTQADIAARNRSNQSDGGGAKPKLTAAQVQAAIKAGTNTPDVLAAYEYYYGAPYEDQSADLNNLDPRVYSSEDYASQFMKENGVDAVTAKGMLTEKEWKTMRSGYGPAPAAVSEFKTYQEYLKAYIEYALS